MKRKTVSPGTQAYYDALKRIFELESGVLTATLPHAGERGRNDEERFRSFLVKVLPRRFSIGTGFLVCSNPELPYSRQMDTVIYDEIHNSPLHRELAAYVFPIEMVYGTIEVKGLLKPGDLVPALQSIARIRRLAREKWYVVYGERAIGQEKPDQLVVDPVEMMQRLAPRAFLFAYDATWKRHSSFVSALKQALMKVPEAHIHGVVILAKEWFACQVAYAGNEPKLKHYTDNGLLRFVKQMIHSLASVPIRQMSIDRYLNVDAPSNTPLQPTTRKRRS
ncbi:MAG: hypothetical protein E6K65_06360 [Nitrospirae bacterium]|nr:MAG: hypothetical protein E6K65_06360 [Nitrospirota bacterium]